MCALPSLDIALQVAVRDYLGIPGMGMLPGDGLCGDWGGVGLILAPFLTWHLMSVPLLPAPSYAIDLCHYAWAAAAVMVVWSAGPSGQAPQPWAVVVPAVGARVLWKLPFWCLL